MNTWRAKIWLKLCSSEMRGFNIPVKQFVLNIKFTNNLLNTMRLMLYIFLIQQLRLTPDTNFKSPLYCRNIPQSPPLTAMTLTVVFLNENNWSFCEANLAVELLELIFILNRIAILQSSALIRITGGCFFLNLCDKNYEFPNAKEVFELYVQKNKWKF